MNTIDTIMQHRSIRKYQSLPIDEATMNQLLECASRAANTGNMQIYSIIVTQEPALKEQLCALHFGQGSSAPAIVTVCVDVNRYHHWCRLRGCDEPYNNFLWLMSGTVDASLAAQNMCLAAESLGLGTCFLGTVMYNTSAIAELLKLPTGVVPVITFSLGYPDGEAQMSERLPVEGIAHKETYKEYSDSDIERVHTIREEFPFNKEMVKLNGVNNLAELFTTKRYPREVNESTSRSLADFCRKAKMME